MAAGEDAVAVAEDDELSHPGWWVVGVDRVAAGVEDGLDGDPVVADPGPILVMVAGPSFSTLPTGLVSRSLALTRM